MSSERSGLPTVVVRRGFELLECELKRDKSEALPSTDAKKIARWAMIFQSVDETTFMAACLKAVTTLKFFPAPSEMLEIIQGKPEQRAEILFDRVRDLVGRLGTDATWFKSDLNGDGSALFAVNAIGLDELGAATRENRSILRGLFRKIYISAVESGSSLDKIIGIHESRNRATGIEMNHPALFGRSPLSVPPELRGLVKNPLEGRDGRELPAPAELVVLEPLALEAKNGDSDKESTITTKGEPVERFREKRMATMADLVDKFREAV